MLPKLTAENWVKGGGAQIKKRMYVQINLRGPRNGFFYEPYLMR